MTMLTTSTYVQRNWNDFMLLRLFFLVLTMLTVPIILLAEVRDISSRTVFAIEQNIDSVQGSNNLKTLIEDSFDSSGIEPRTAEDAWPADDEWDMNGNQDSRSQFDLQSTVFGKYPDTPLWPFPLDNRLNESLIRYNRIEGLYIGLSQPKRLYWHSKPNFVFTGNLGYGFSAHRWRFGAGLHLPLYFDNQILEFGIEGHSNTDSHDQWIVHREENTATAFLAREDFMDYFGREGFSLKSAWYYRGLEGMLFSATLGYVHDNYHSLASATGWSLFGGDKSFRPNPVISDGNVNSIVFSIAWSSTPTFTMHMDGWDTQLSLEYAGSFARGDFDFTQFSFDCKRFSMLTDFLNVNVRLLGGASDGNIPLQRVYAIGGISTLPGFRYKEFAGSRVLLFNAEIIFRSTPIFGDASGWIGSLFSALNLILFTDAGATKNLEDEIRGDNVHSSFSNGLSLGRWIADVGLALGSADGAFRIGAAWRTDRAETPNFVLRFARPF